MKRLYCALLLAVLVLSGSAAGLTWKRIRLESAGTISLPQSWNVLPENSAVIENAYGAGVSCRTLLTAQASNASITILLYWPYTEENAQKFASDIAETLRRQYGTNSRPSPGEMKIGTIRASSLTYSLDNLNDQKVTAFTRSGKVYCLISNYKHTEEYSFSRLIRNIISRWQF